MIVVLRGLAASRTKHFLTNASTFICNISRLNSENTMMTDLTYEAAVRTLLDFQSNAETINKARLMREEKLAHAIPNMLKFIHRSGLSNEDIDKLSVIHVSGTKGKGSTCAFCERILSCYGYKTGMFTSPHLVQVRERIRINGRPISQELFSHYFWKVYNNLKQTQSEATEKNISFQQGSSFYDGGGMPAYFAFLTVLSLHVFLAEGVDVAIMEVGIGGEYDSTNVFCTPAVCGVTSLGLDHTALLGSTIEEIAWNKAGIFKAGRPAITVLQEPAAMEVIVNRSKEKQAPLFLSKSITTDLIEKYGVMLGIAGKKQCENASLAIHLSHMWRKVHAGAQITNTIAQVTHLEVEELDHATIRGLSTCTWPGRSQMLCCGPVTYYLDGAHTKESMELCVEWFKEAADKEKEAINKQVARILIFNATGDRDVEPFLANLQTCSFNAAVFCPNILSNVESLNRTDQVIKKVTAQWMLEKVQSNKSIWDQLGAQYISMHSKALASNGFRQLPSDTGDRLSSGDQQVHGCALSQLDHNSNVADLNCSNELVVQMLENVVSDGPSKCKKITRGPSLVAGQTRCFCHSSIGNKLLPEHCSGCSGSSQEQAENPLDYLPSQSHQDDLAPSLTFPCILQALAWATQGRDPQVKVNDPNFDLPPTPALIKKADCLQILITGSLHLIGGVLGVVDPSMND